MKLIATLALCALLPLAAPAEESSTPPAQEDVVAQILELQHQLEELLATLPPEVRAKLRQRLAAPPPPEPADTSEEAVATAPATEPAKPVVETVKPVVEPPTSGIPKLIRRRSRRAPCNTLHSFDENGDGKISSADRYWRYLYLWTDKNGDRQIQDREVESAYNRRIREIAVSLETFVRTKGGLGEVRIEDQIVLDLRGDGFAERDRRDDGVLVIDAGALNRGNGPRLFGPGGEALRGFAPFRSGLRLELAGAVTELNCP